jgi:uncharacterized membrane protein YbhN (UPF0104 family)
VYLVWLVVAHRAELDRAVLRFQGARTRWLLAAIGLEVLSQTMSVVVQRRLLRRAGTTMTVFATTRMVLAQNALGLALPGGQLVAAGFSYGQIRRRGASSSVATWVVAATSVIGLLALVAFGAFTATGFSWLSMVAGLAVVAVLILLVMFVRAPDRVRQPTLQVMRSLERFRRRDARGPTVEERLERRLDALRQVQLRWADWVLLAVFALAAVAADCAVWICASHAIIVLPTRCLSTGLAPRVAQQCAAFHAPTTAGLLIAYSAGQGALALPLLPGGLGLVESVMTTALTASKVRAIQALSAVLLYRLISFWTVVVVGGLMWLTLRRRPVVAAAQTRTPADDPFETTSTLTAGPSRDRGPPTRE